MAKASIHGRIIAAAARPVLGPLGFKQKGRSRLWIADQRFWAIIVEFQPSGWSQGSYLNVAAMWLWYAKDHWSLDYFRSGHPRKEFFPFVDEQQFTPVAEKLASAAAHEVASLRQEFASLESTAQRLVARVSANPWSIYNAGVAAGLIGDLATAHRLFLMLAQLRAVHDWEKKLQANSALLSAQLAKPGAYRETLIAEIAQCRALLGFPPAPNCLPEPGIA
jgi:hypothetical protein